MEALEAIRAAGLAVSKNTWMMDAKAQLTAQRFALICIGEARWFFQAALRDHVANVTVAGAAE